MFRHLQDYLKLQGCFNSMLVRAVANMSSMIQVDYTQKNGCTSSPSDFIALAALVETFVITYVNTAAKILDNVIMYL